MFCLFFFLLYLYFAYRFLLANSIDSDQMLPSGHVLFAFAIKRVSSLNRLKSRV